MTSSATAIIDRAKALGVQLRVEGDKIKARGPLPAVEEVLPALREHKPAVLAVLLGGLDHEEAKVEEKSSAAGQPDARCGHWLIALPPERLERWFSPPVTRAELETRYPGAVLVALPETASEHPRPATKTEMAELRRLVAAVAAQEAFSADELAEAEAHALGDPQGALCCFRALLEVGRRGASDSENRKGS